jgi:two-component system CheB/CheR fusion protein
VQEARRVAESIVDAVREPLLVLDAKLKVVSASRAFYEHFQVKAEETVGRAIHELGDRQWDIAALRKLLDSVQFDGQAFDDFVVEHDFPRIGKRRLVLNARRILGKTLEGQLILLAISPPSVDPDLRDPPRT